MIYVASSWRNTYYPDVVKRLREEGMEVYDFRNPPNGDPGFKWEKVDSNYMEWTPSEYRDHLSHHPLAVRQFDNDIKAMEECDTCVLVLPCGRSAHTEAGWFAGKGKTTIVYIPERQEAELMYRLFDNVCVTMDEVVATLTEKGRNKKDIQQKVTDDYELYCREQEDMFEEMIGEDRCFPEMAEGQFVRGH